jgi:hypothetical protein
VTVAQLAERLGVTERQVQYCRQAAAILGLLVADAPGRWGLTAGAQAIAVAPLAEARRLLARAIGESALVRLAGRRVAGLRDERDRLSALARLLAGCTVLGEATCLRRAQTLLAWLRWARDVQDGFQETLLREVPPAPQETEDAPVA